MARKRTYRSETVNSASKRLPTALAGLERVVVGLDIAKEKQFAALMNEDKEVLGTICFTSPKDNQAFVDLIKTCAPQVEVVLESTGTYGDVLIHTLRTAGIPVFRVATKKVHDAKELFDGVPSIHDAKAAMIIARLHLDKLTKPWKELTDHQRQLKSAVRTFTRYQGHLQTNIGRLEALLARVWPELPAELELASPTLIRVVARYGTPARLAAAKPKSSKAYMRKIGGRFLTDEKIETVISSARSSVGVPLIKAEREELQLLAEDSYRLRFQTNEMRKTVEKLGQENESAQNLKELVGGLSIAIVLMSVGDPRDFSSSNALLKAFGLNLKQHSSGKKAGQLAIAKRSASLPRHYLFMAAMRLIKNDEITKAWYIRRLERNGVKKVKAIVAVMRKLVRAIWQIARTGEAFDGARLFDTTNLQPLLDKPLIIPKRTS